MKKTLSLSALFILTLILAGGFSRATGAELPDPAGHWEGQLTLPGTSLEIRLDFEESPDDGLSGSIDIPVQGMRGFQVSELVYSEGDVSFALPGIPGDPRFQGTLSSDGKTFSGKLSQSGQSFDFSVTRAVKQASKGETPSHGIPGEGYAGIWQGTLRPGGMELRLLFKLSRPDDDMPSTLDSIDQNTSDLPISSISYDMGNLGIQIDKPNARFEGVMSEDGSEVVGHWIQGGGKLPLTIKRLEKQPDLARYQDPVKPYPYLEEEVNFENVSAGIQLSGTLTVPFSEDPHPAVVLISGSGPQDRDEALMGHRPFLVLADRLTRSGIAVLRYDDRGFGKSTGSFSAATTSDFTSDTVAAVDFLKSRRQIDSQRIGLVGHSEGGLVAPAAAASRSDIAFVVLLSAPGVPMDELLARQSQDMLRISGASEEIQSTQAALQKSVFEAVKAASVDSDLKSQIGPRVQEAFAALDPADRETLGVDDDQIENQIRMVATPWFHELLSIDPRIALRALRCPVLALNGAKDSQVAAEVNLGSIEKTLTEAGNDRVTAIELPGLNHLFQTCETGAVTEYGMIEETFNEAALGVITDWIRKVSALD